MAKLKNITSLFIIFIAAFAIYINKDKIMDEFNDFFNDKRELKIPEVNRYRKDYGFQYVQLNDTYVPYNKKDLYNIYYSVLNNGWTYFTFYCPTEYTNCIADITELSKNKEILALLNNFVHPYNQYSTIKTLYDTSGEITIRVTHEYTDEEIVYYDKIIKQMIEEFTDDSMSTKDKIKVLHDYIINNTKYDKDQEQGIETEYDSYRIGGVVRDHYAVCSGYSDLMAALLFELGVPNFMISTDVHIWNALYLDGEWLHLDVTWDDPVTNTGEDILLYDYFLINSQTLNSVDSEEKKHLFDENIFSEVIY